MRSFEIQGHYLIGDVRTGAGTSLPEEVQTWMLDPRRIRHTVTHVASAVAFLAAAGGAVAEEGNSAGLQVYQQRTADGQIVLTDLASHIEGQ